jgi:hypothetical protein
MHGARQHHSTTKGQISSELGRTCLVARACQVHDAAGRTCLVARGGKRARTLHAAPQTFQVVIKPTGSADVTHSAVHLSVSKALLPAVDVVVHHVLVQPGRPPMTVPVVAVPSVHG